MRRAIITGLCALIVAGCGDDGPLTATVATARAVRGRTALAEAAVTGVARVEPGAEIAVSAPGLAHLELDSGPRLLLGDGAALTVLEDDAVELTGGRTFAEVRAGERLRVRVDALSLRAHRAGVSIEREDGVTRAYVVRGEISWALAGARGIVGAGRALVVDGSGARVEAVTLWDDWTGGLAEPGPAATLAPEGIGVIAARVPDEVGRARWPLVVRRLDVRVRVEGDLAVTEVDQVFFNPASETVEGLYRMRAPRGAVLSRFAVDRDGALVEGYVRERGQALRSYEEQVYRGSTDDPALLEWDGPQAYSARIYPIRPGETRRIVVRYGEWLTRRGARRTYRYPMGGAAAGDLRIQELSLSVDVDDAEVDSLRAGLGARIEGTHVRLRRSDFQPRADFWLDLDGPEVGARAWRAAHEPPHRVTALRSGVNESDERDYWWLPLVIPTDLADEGPSGIDLVIVADLSSGTDRAHLELGHGVLEALARHLGPDDRIAVVGADLGLRAITDDEDALALGPATDARTRRLLEGAARAPAGGATDLGAALVEAAALLDPTRDGAVVYVGDARPTVGERDAGALRDRLARLPEPVRLYGVAVGAEADVALLDALTEGGGLAARVTGRRDAARATLDLLAHARRPVAHRVVVELGDSIANAYPRRPVDAVLGEVLAVVGRVDGEPPASVRVTGVVRGEPFEREIALTPGPIAAATDLRLRWAGARLRQLLLDGATREEVAELGVRYGMITPYTSYYVPSAREAAAASPAVDAPAAAMPESEPEEPMPVEAATAEPAPAPPPRPVRRRAPSTAVPGPAPVDATDGSGSVAATGAVDRGLVQRLVRAQQPALQRCYDAAARANPSVATRVSASFTVTAQGTVTGLSVSGGDASLTSCVRGVIAAIRFPSSSAPLRVQIPLRFTAGGGPTFHLLVAQLLPLAIAAAEESERADAHRVRRCSDAARLPLDERVALWRERLERDGWLPMQVQAIRACEARSWRARRALLGVILSRAGSVPAMLEVYRHLTSPSARAHARAEILRRVRSPQDLRAVRHAFGDADTIDWGLVEQILERAADDDARARALRRLVLQFPRSFELKLRLLHALDRVDRTAEADRLASRMRVDPLADPGVRTAIGERLLAAGRPDDARRAFSEIVEHAPLDELARRRLGDLYRAHGWYDEAYRQYETLRDLRPDDPSVLLLLAQAAAGAGRVDEALRLEARLAQTAQPGRARGIARTALLWSSVRFARLRREADAERRARLRRRMRRTGVLGQAVDLRVSLTFAHPDAQVSLWVAAPGQRLARATDVAPEHGIEVYERADPEPGPVRLEVRRPEGLTGTVEAALTVVWDEGGEGERVEVLALRFDAERATRAFVLEDRALSAL